MLHRGAPSVCLGDDVKQEGWYLFRVGRKSTHLAAPLVLFHPASVKYYLRRTLDRSLDMQTHLANKDDMLFVYSSTSAIFVCAQHENVREGLKEEY